MRDWAPGAPKLGRGTNPRTAWEVAFNCEAGILLLGNAVAITVPFGPRRRDLGSKMGTLKLDKSPDRKEAGGTSEMVADAPERRRVAS